MNKKLVLVVKVILVFMSAFAVSLGAAWLHLAGVIKLDAEVFKMALLGMMVFGYILFGSGVAMWVTKYPRRIDWKITAVAFACLTFAIVGQGWLFGSTKAVLTGVVIGFILAGLCFQTFFKKTA